MKKFICIASGSLALGIAAQAATVTVSYTNTIPSTLTSWEQNLEIQRFDPALGSLDSADLAIYSALTTSLVVTNFSGATLIAGNVSTEVQISLAANSFGSLDTNVTSNPVLDYNSGHISLIGLQTGHTYSGSKTGNSGWVDSGSFSDGTTLAELTGSGYYDLGANALALSSLSYDGGNVTATQVTSASLESIVTYTYETPEPSSIALMGSGLAGALFTLRRRFSR